LRKARSCSAMMVRMSEMCGVVVVMLWRFLVVL
jgi:hypothetical protein